MIHPVCEKKKSTPTLPRQESVEARPILSFLFFFFPSKETKAKRIFTYISPFFDSHPTQPPLNSTHPFSQSPPFPPSPPNMNFGKWLGIGGIKDFPYDLGEVLEVQPSSHWTQRRGTRQADSVEVTIFQYEKKPADTDETSLACNGWKKTKMLKLPGFLKCLDAVDTPTHYYIATEECRPLVDVLENTDEFGEDDKKEEFIAYGVYSIVQALSHLHERQLMHGNCGKHAVYCTKSGDWRLWGLDWVTNLADSESSSHFKSFFNYLPVPYLSPELAKENWSAVEKSPVHAIDAWSLGCLIYEVFNGDLPDSASAMKTRKNIPSELYSAYTGLLHTAPRARANTAKLLSTDYFEESTYISVQKEIDNLSLKDQVDRDRFFRKLASVVNQFPLSNCKYTVLPKLTTALTYGAGGASALEPMLIIGKRLTESEYTELVVPGVVQLFSSGERIVRIKLLQNVQSFAKAIPQHLLCTQIWPLLAQGFVNNVPEIRELTIKSMVSIVPKLTPPLVDEAVKQLIRLQGDIEGGIRTNATICLGMVAQHIPAGERQITLHKAFAKMLKDKFIHSRGAALGSYIACIDVFDIGLAAQGVIPALSPSLVDPEKDIRSKALKALKAYLAKVESGQDSIHSPPPAAAASPVTPGKEAEGGSWGWASSLGGLGKANEPGGNTTPAATTSTPKVAAVTTTATPSPAATPTPPAEVVDTAAWGDDDDIDMDMDDDTTGGGGGGGDSWGAPVPAPVMRAKKHTPPNASLGEDGGGGGGGGGSAGGHSPPATGPRLGGMKLGGMKPKKKGLGALKKND